MLNKEEIRKYIQQLKDAYPDIESIWLIGSQANNTANENSDWDFLVFANKNILLCLKENIAFKRDKIDLLVVDEEGNFNDPWSDKKGNISSWEWQEESEAKARYRSTKFIPDYLGSDLGDIKEEWLRASKLL